MYAIVQDRGRQYKVEKGQSLEVDVLSAEKGSEIIFDKVMAIGEGEKLSLGSPFVEGAVVKAIVTGDKKGKKILVHKFKRRKGYKRKNGHRQKFTLVEILSIDS